MSTDAQARQANSWHQMSTTTQRDEYVLNCTCRPSGSLFIGSAADCARNMAQHQAAITQQAGQLIIGQDVTGYLNMSWHHGLSVIYARGSWL